MVVVVVWVGRFEGVPMYVENAEGGYLYSANAAEDAPVGAED